MDTNGLNDAEHPKSVPDILIQNESMWCALRLLEFCFPEALDSVSSAHSPVIKMFEPALAVRIVLERLVVEPSIELLTGPGLLPRPVQLLRKALLVDRLPGVLQPVKVSSPGTGAS